MILGDAEGDALDAVLAAVAGATLAGDFRGPGDDAAGGEGWIYSLD